MIENVFRKKYAECLIARKETSDGSKGEAVGLALVSLLASSFVVFQQMLLGAFCGGLGLLPMIY
jgi:hypothetical protein